MARLRVGWVVPHSIGRGGGRAGKVGGGGHVAPVTGQGPCVPCARADRGPAGQRAPDRHRPQGAGHAAPGPPITLAMSAMCTPRPPWRWFTGRCHWAL